MSETATIQVNDAGLKDLFKRMQKFGGDNVRVLSRLNVLMLQNVQQHFRKKEAPEGKWEPLKFRKGQALRDTGRLYASIQKSRDIGRNATVVGSNVIYAPVHNFGATIPVTDKMRNFLRYKGINLKRDTRVVKIPKREFMWLDFGFYDKAKKVVADEIAKQLKGTVGLS